MSAWLYRVRALPGFVDDLLPYPDKRSSGRQPLDLRPMSAGTWSPIVEFRQYTLHPGARDTLIELFDRELIVSQEELGMKVIGQFRPLALADMPRWQGLERKVVPHLTSDVETWRLRPTARSQCRGAA